MALAYALSSRRRQLAFKTEATKGTYETLAFGTDDDIQVHDLQVSTAFGRFDRDVQRSTLTKLAGLVGQKAVKISFSVECRHHQATNTPDKWMELFTACGMTASAASGAANGSKYVFADTPSDVSPTAFSTLSFMVAIAARGAGAGLSFGIKVKGASGKWTMDAKVGAPIMFHFEFDGVFSDFLDMTLTAPVTTESSFPVTVFQGVGLTIGTSAGTPTADVAVSSFSLDSGVVVVPRDSVNSTAGIAYFTTIDRKPTCTLDPDLSLEADSAELKWYNSLDQNVDLTVTFTLSDALTLTIASMRLLSVGDGNRNGIATASLTLEIVNATAAAELSLAFI